jgi:hypothetical protein
LFFKIDWGRGDEKMEINKVNNKDWGKSLLIVNISMLSTQNLKK